MQAQILPQQIQKTILAPVMQQSIEVLLLSVNDINLSIEQELQDNPLLEASNESISASEMELENMVFDNRNLSRLLSANFSSGDDEGEDMPIKIETSLEENLLRQLRVEFDDPLAVSIGEYFIGNLDEDGYLKITCQEAANIFGIQNLNFIDGVLKTIQGFEPLGIASRDLKECLSIQANASGHPNKDILLKLIDNHLYDLGHKRFAQISKDTGFQLERIKEAAIFVAGLEPKPARNFRPIRSSIYIKPDVFIVRDENGYHVEVSREGVIPLRVNAYYRDMLNRPDLSVKDREFIQEKFYNAVNFIKSIKQREITLKRIGEYILMRQMAFFEHGSDLVPMILKDVACAINRNESTISRAISNKFIETPIGVFPVKFFFSQGVGDSGFVASRSIKEEIQRIIIDEDKSSPLSDQDIQSFFKRRNMRIARRTISKYRQSLKILPSHLRKI